MNDKPDYTSARSSVSFEWSAGGSQDALRELAGIPIREFNLKPEACIEAYRKGLPRHRELFGEEVALPALATPAISYGHVNGLGSELIFPEDGEVGHTPIHASLAEGISALQNPVDFSRAGLAPFYVDFLAQMKRAFPGEAVRFRYGLEGPITTAWELRGQNFFMDPYDDPERTHAYLKLVTASIIEFNKFRLAADGSNQEAVNPCGAGLADDIAAMLPPALWPEFVLPYWEQYFAGLTTGKRYAHVEDLTPAHLPYLEEIGLSFYDPSISPRLNPQTIGAHCRVPFAWRLGSFHYSKMTEQDVADFVWLAVADGAGSVTTVTEACMCNAETAAKVKVFVRTAREAAALFKQGLSREELGRRAGATGRQRMWGLLMK